MCLRLWTLSLACLSVTALAPPLMGATAIDLTVAGSSATGTFYGAIYTTNFTQPAGSGVIGSILRVQSPGSATIEKGYNTDTPITGSPKLPFDALSGVSLHNGDVRVGDLQVVTVGGLQYVPFCLDLQEPNNDPNRLISLDRLSIYVGAPHANSETGVSADGLTGDVAALGTKVYDMDVDFGAPPDQYIKLNSANAPGSGKFNLEVLIPVSRFNGFTDTQAVYLFNVFGVQNSADPGTGAEAAFEEWSLCSGGPRVIPLPPAALAGLSLLGLIAGVKRIRARRSA